MTAHGGPRAGLTGSRQGPPALHWARTVRRSTSGDLAPSPVRPRGRDGNGAAERLGPGSHTAAPRSDAVLSVDQSLAGSPQATRLLPSCWWRHGPAPRAPLQAAWAPEYRAGNTAWPGRSRPGYTLAALEGLGPSRRDPLAENPPQLGTARSLTRRVQDPPRPRSARQSVGKPRLQGLTLSSCWERAASTLACAPDTVGCGGPAQVPALQMATHRHSEPRPATCPLPRAPHTTPPPPRVPLPCRDDQTRRPGRGREQPPVPRHCGASGSLPGLFLGTHTSSPSALFSNG